MTPLPHHVEQFRGHIARHLGLHFKDDPWNQLSEVLEQRLNHTGLSSEAYLAQLAESLDTRERGALAQALTITETYFFRHIDQFHALQRIALPQRARARAGGGRLHLLSAGCASGEEPYSLAMVLRQTSDARYQDAMIRAIDINPAMIDKARKAQYSPWALRETPAHQQQRWFREKGADWVLEPAIRNAVTFETGNLVDADMALWTPHTYDVVFCRNVLMYLLPCQARAVVHRIAQALVPGGYLFLGHAETLRELSDDFVLKHTEGTFYYQRRANAAARVPQETEPPRAEPANAAVPRQEPEAGNASWVDVIRRASARIEVLATPPPAAPESAWDQQRVLELLQDERFKEALALLRAAPAASERAPAVLLLNAVVLTHSSHLQEAEMCCRTLLSIDPDHAGAHCVLALCREGAGDYAGAADFNRQAAGLDPTFAIPHMHLGLLAQRAGDLPEARKELQLALTLLQTENAARLLLFGGGFGRESLMAICRAALTACGSAA